MKKWNQIGMALTSLASENAPPRGRFQFGGQYTCLLSTELISRRAFIYQPNAYAIDTLLLKMVPDKFKAVRIE